MSSSGEKTKEEEQVTADEFILNMMSLQWQADTQMAMTNRRLDT